MKRMLVAAALALSTPAFAQGVPVVDKAAILQMIKTVEEMHRQYQVALRQYEAVTGARGLGDLLRNPVLRQALPHDVGVIYDASRRVGYGGVYGATGAARKVLEAEVLTGSTDEQIRQAQERRRMTPAAERALVVEAYEGMQRRAGVIEALTDQINRTTDMKAIAELQARIATEQAHSINDANKIALLAVTQRSEAALMDEQRDAIGRHILSMSNTGMPTIR